MNKLTKAAETAVQKEWNNAVERVIEKVEWVNTDATQSAKMKVADAKKTLITVWNEYLAFNDAIAAELELEKPSDALPNDSKSQILGFVSYLNGFLDSCTEDEVQCYHYM